MNPIIKRIYIAYFYQDEWKTMGLSKEYSLLSAIQNRSWRNQYLIGMPEYDPVFNEAYKWVMKYTTCEL